MPEQLAAMIAKTMTRYLAPDRVNVPRITQPTLPPKTALMGAIQRGNRPYIMPVVWVGKQMLRFDCLSFWTVVSCSGEAG